MTERVIWKGSGHTTWPHGRWHIVWRTGTPVTARTYDPRRP